MPRYISVQWQYGKGCDYTIGCGVCVDDLGEHPNAEAAIAKATGNDADWFVRNHVVHDAEQRLKSVVVYEIASMHVIDLNAMLYDYERRCEDKRIKKSIKDRDAAELAEYERLRKKFGK